MKRKLLWELNEKQHFLVILILFRYRSIITWFIWSYTYFLHRGKRKSSIWKVWFLVLSTKYYVEKSCELTLLVFLRSYWNRSTVGMLWILKYVICMIRVLLVKLMFMSTFFMCDCKCLFCGRFCLFTRTFQKYNPAVKLALSVFFRCFCMQSESPLVWV